MERELMDYLQHAIKLTMFRFFVSKPHTRNIMSAHKSSTEISSGHISLAAAFIKMSLGKNSP